MNEHVALNVGSLTEFFSTHVTLVRFESGMHAHVNLESRVLGYFLATDLTLITLNSEVCPFVSLEIALETKGFSA